MPLPDAAREPTVFEWPVQMIARIITAGIVSNPLVVGVNVRSFRMSAFVRKTAVWLRGGLWLGGRLLRPGWRGTVRGNVSAANATDATAL
jgi:hypothetical protein